MGQAVITTSTILKTVGAIGGTVGAFLWVPDALEVGKDWAGEKTIQAVNELKVIHKDDLDRVVDRIDDGFRMVNVEMATSLHRAIESSKISSRIHDYKLEVIKLRMELRKTAGVIKTREIERDINRLEKDIEREKDRMDKIETLTKAQIGELIGNECCERDNT